MIYAGRSRVRVATAYCSFQSFLLPSIRRARSLSCGYWATADADADADALRLGARIFVGPFASLRRVLRRRRAPTTTSALLGPPLKTGIFCIHRGSSICHWTHIHRHRIQGNDDTHFLKHRSPFLFSKNLASWWCRGHSVSFSYWIAMASEFPDEVLKSVFPLLDGKDLVFCMLVCRQWRGIAKDDYFWKCICSRKWPSICKLPPSDANYKRLYLTFSKPREMQNLPVPRLTFEDIVFYIDMWLEGSLIFSQAVSGSTLRTGLQCAPCGIPDILAAHLNSQDCILMLEVEPKLSIPMGPTITISVLAHRKDTNKMACIINKSTFDYIDSNASRALAYEYLRFSPRHPFISDIRAWMSLLFLYKGANVIEVFGIELDFCDAARSENEILWLLDMLDWK